MARTNQRIECPAKGVPGNELSLRLRFGWEELMTKKNVLVVCVAILLIVVIGLIVHSAHGSRVLADRALNVIDSLQAGDYQKATRDFAVEALPIFRGKLPVQWPTVIAKVGSLKARNVTRVDRNAVHITCTFERATLYAVVDFDIQKNINGFTLSSKPQR